MFVLWVKLAKFSWSYVYYVVKICDIEAVKG